MPSPRRGLLPFEHPTAPSGCFHPGGLPIKEAAARYGRDYFQLHKRYQRGHVRGRKVAGKIEMEPAALEDYLLPCGWDWLAVARGRGRAPGPGRSGWLTTRQLAEKAGVTTYAGDLADQLLSLDGPSGVITFTCDGNGSLVQRGWNWARRELRWSQRRVWVDRALSLHPGYALMKEVNRSLYGVSRLDPRAVDGELQERYAAAVQSLAVGMVYTCACFVV